MKVQKNESEKEYLLLSHLVRIWRAPFCADNWKDKFYAEAEDFIQKNFRKSSDILISYYQPVIYLKLILLVIKIWDLNQI